MKRKIIYTIGHSTHSAEEFINLLTTYEIEMVLDVRTIPKSNFNPQYNMESLIITLQEAGINYTHLPKLGGLRHASKDSINTGWRNPSFRGYADYMQTPQFQEGLEELATFAMKYNSVIMCAEALPWRCHRSLIADALTLSHWKDLHIMNKKSTKLHELTDFLHVKKGKLIYLA